MQVVSTVCDFGDGFDGEECRFSLDGQDYRIDLCKTHSEALDDMGAPWVSHATRIGRDAVTAVTQSRPASSRRRSQAIRAWGLAQGLMAGQDRGRIPVSVIRSYNEAHQ